MYPRATEPHNTYYGHPGSSMHPETYDSQYSPVMSSSPKIIPVANVHHPRPTTTNGPDFIPSSSAATASTPSDELRQDSGYFERSYKRSSARSTSSMERLSLQDPPPPTHKAAELWAVPPQQPVAVNETTDSNKQAAPVSLWAVPPQRHPEPSSSSSSAAAEEEGNKPIPSVSLWAVPPQSSSSSSLESSSANDESKKQQQQQTTSLWAVPPQHSMESSNDLDTNNASEPVSLWAVPPQKEHETPSSSSSLWAVPPQKEHETPSSSSSSSSSLWAVPPQKTPDPVKQQSTSLWAVPPQRSLDPVTEVEDIPEDDNNNKHAPVSLWAVPPQHGLEGEGDASAATSSDHSGDGLWAVPPSNAESSNSEADDLTLKPRPRPSASTESTLKKRWHHRRQYSDGGRVTNGSEPESMGGNRRTVRFVSPNATSYVEDGVEKLSLRDEAASSSNESGQLDDKQQQHRNNHNLHIQIPASDDDTTISSRSPRTPRQRTPLSANSSSGASPISSSHETSEHEDETWGERPSIEQLYRDIDKYLPGHDLDKEIFIDTSNPAAAGAGPTAATPGTSPNNNAIAAAAAQSAAAAAAAPAPRRLQGHKKSIRVVANEAHRNWRQAMNVIRVNHLLRRRSTKMWGRKVEQVKPGMIIEEQSIPKESQDAGYIGMCGCGGHLFLWVSGY